MEILKKESQTCQKCGKNSETLINGLCLDCYDLPDMELEIDQSPEEDDLYQKLQEKYDQEVDREKTKQEMIVQGMKLKKTDNPSRAIDKINKIFRQKRKK